MRIKIPVAYDGPPLASAPVRAEPASKDPGK
jgi:hypothetical protein